MTRIMKYLRAWLLAAFALSAAAANSAGPQDFRSGIELLPVAGRPLGELTLPDAVYQGVTRPDLGDLRVFNAQGTPVPSALCAPPPLPPAAGAELPLKVYPLEAARAAANAGRMWVEVETGGGATVDVKPVAADTKEAAEPATEVSAYVIDARDAVAPLDALRVRWRSADGASELQVRVEASEDLDRWTTLVTQAALVQAAAAGQTLQREQIALPPGRHAYLRLSRNDPGPAPELDEVIAELQPLAAPEEAPRWFQPAPLAQPPGHGYAFDAARLAPVHTAQIVLPASNMTLQLALQSRATVDGAWRTVWSGAVYSLGAGDAERHNDDLRFAADSDRYWQIQVLQGADTLGASLPTLRLGYHPARLRFLAQGSGNFLLAYGSVRAVLPPASACAALLPGLAPADLQSMIGAAQPGATRVLGGDAVLAPAPKPTPLRQIVLWAVLVLGAAAVAWMALSLLRALRREGT